MRGLFSVLVLTLSAGVAAAQNNHLDLSIVRTGQVFEANQLHCKVVKIRDASSMAVIIDNRQAPLDPKNLVIIKCSTASFSDNSYIPSLEELAGKKGKVRVTGTTTYPTETVFVLEPVLKSIEGSYQQRLDEAEQAVKDAQKAVKDAQQVVEDTEDALKRTVSLDARTARQRKLQQAQKNLKEMQKNLEVAQDALKKVKAEDAGK